MLLILLGFFFESGAMPEPVGVAAPIVAVTVYGDQARVTRRGLSPPGAGLVALRLPDLPGATRIDALRVQAEGARVVRVEGRAEERDQTAIDRATALLDALEARQDELAVVEGERQVLYSEAILLARVAPALPMPEEERPGPAALSPDTWSRVLTFLDDRRRLLDERVAVLDAEIRKKSEMLAVQRAELAEFDERAFSTRNVQVTVVLDQPGPVPVEVQYLVPGAGWVPQYRIERVPGQDRLHLSTAGRVKQTTGEDWADVAVTLSTATPIHLDLPVLDTWTLGEKRDFLPRPVAKKAVESRPLPVIDPVMSVADFEEASRLHRLRERLVATRGEKDQEAPVNQLPKPMGGKQGGEAQTEIELEVKVVEVTTPDAPRLGIQWGGAPLKDPPFIAGPRAAEDQKEFMLDRRFPSVTGIRGGVDEIEELEYSRVGYERPNMSLDLFDNRVIGRRHGRKGSPAALAGGLDFEYPAITRMNLPSQPEEQQVPLAVETFEVAPYYEVAPGLKSTAFLKATVRNTGQRPVLGGLVNLFVGTDFIGQGKLETTGPGGELVLPLGADEDLKVVRRVVPHTVTEGVFSSEVSTTYKTTIEVRNGKAAAVKVRVVDQVPISHDEDIQVKVRALVPPPVEGPDREGKVAFDLTIAPGAIGQVQIDYTIKRPEGHQVRQR